MKYSLLDGKVFDINALGLGIQILSHSWNEMG